MNVLDYVNNNITYMDGGMGTLLQARGLMPGEYPERWNISHSDVITDIQKAYFDAGSNIIVANTFGANLLKFEEAELREIIKGAVINAREAARQSCGTQEKFVALDVGPSGKLLEPFGDYRFDDAVKLFAKTISIGAECGVDLIFIETMNDSYETKAALLAAKENCSLPVFVSNAYGTDGKLMTGATPQAMIAMLEGMGADAIGINCSLGPAQMKDIVADYLEYSSVPVLLKPNAGLPKVVDGKVAYDVLPDEFGDLMEGYCTNGVRIMGGCCGTNPEYIRATVSRTKNIPIKEITDKQRTVISSYSHAVVFDKTPVLIGERINPTGKKRFKEALRENDIDYILGEGIAQQEKGVQVLDVNVGLPEIDETEMLRRVCFELQAVIDLPLQIDTSSVTAMEAALRYYNGKAMINSVNGKKESMEAVFPLVKKYGGLVVCLTLDERGIPDNAADRIEIAETIINTAKEYGISKKNLIFDTLAMTVSADDHAALATTEALNFIRNKLGCHTILGVSNISFGLPARECITAAFFTIAMEDGLSAAIMNPNSAEMMKSWYCFRVLKGLDKNCEAYIENIEKYAALPAVAVKGNVIPEQTKEAEQKGENKQEQSELQRAIIKGLKEQAAALTGKLLEREDPLSIVTEQIIPALDTVGIGFEKKTMYLPQLLMSAEAAQRAFELIKEKMVQDSAESISRGNFVIATVKGDIHDIGKNIVKLILENYGFHVIDLGRDVPPEKVVEETIKNKAPIVGLSALMTTTVPAMEETIKLLREKVPGTRVVVGGAVLTQEYADRIGADCYAKDAMATVRYAMEIVSSANQFCE